MAGTPNTVWRGGVVHNLIEDSLSDLGPAFTGTIAVAPYANFNPSRRPPSMFEPVHGSAPAIAGPCSANPVGHIRPGAMLPDHLCGAETGAMVLVAIKEVLLDPQAVPTTDLGDNGSTEALRHQIAGKLP